MLALTISRFRRQWEEYVVFFRLWLQSIKSKWKQYQRLRKAKEYRRIMGTNPSAAKRLTIIAHSFDNAYERDRAIEAWTEEQTVLALKAVRKAFKRPFWRVW